MAFSRAQFFSFAAGLAASISPHESRRTTPPWDPLPPPMPIGARRALVMSGAGARGAYEAGALNWLYRDVVRSGQPFEVICGSSAGAINAAFAAVGTADAMQQVEDLWKSISADNIVELQPPIQEIIDAGLQVQQAAKLGFPSDLSYLNRARMLLNEAGTPADIDKLGGALRDAGIRSLVKRYPLSLETLQASLFITATNITRMTSDSFYKFVGSEAATNQQRFLDRVQPLPSLKASDGAPPLMRQLPLHHELTQDNFIDALVASISMPGVFKPVVVRHSATTEADLYVDGGVVSNLSVSLAAETGACDITILLASAPGEVPKNDATLFGVLHETYTLMHEQILQDDINLAIATNLIQRDRDHSGLNRTSRTYLRALQRNEWQPLTLRVIRPRSPLEVLTMGFNHQEGIEAAFAEGYLDASRPYVYEMG